MSRGIKRILFIDFIVCSLMIFYKLIPTYFVAVIMASFVFLNIILLLRYFSLTKVFVVISIVLVPVSFISLVGTSTELFPISWFHVLVIVSFISIIIFKRAINKRYFIHILVFFVYAVFICAIQKDVADGIKQAIMICLFMLSFIIGDSLSQEECDENLFFWLFTTGALAVAVQVIVQYIFFNRFGIMIGETTTYGTGVRTARAGLMGDYSFASLYIAAGLFAVVLKYLDKREIRFTYFFVLSVFFIIGILFTTARTGIVSFGITLVIYYLCHLDKMKWQHFLVIIIATIALPFIINEFTAARGAQSLLDSSGRIENYFLSLSAFSEHPFWGIGLGLKNLKMNTGLDVPHNFIIQYLLQIGVIGTVLISLPFLCFFSKQRKNRNQMKWFVILLMVGAMFIPDITNSRFLHAAIICASIKLQNEV